MKIIAEIGSNFKSLKDCLTCIEMASVAGASAVKFQLASFEELYGKKNEVLPGRQAEFDKRFIKQEWLPILRLHADKHNIEFMCSAFSLNGYEVVNEYVSTHKVASCENMMFGWHEYLIRTGKEIIISLGGTGLPGIYHLRDFYAAHGDVNKITFMHCSLEYPAKNFCIAHIAQMADHLNLQTTSFQFGLGISDHTNGLNSLVSEINGFERYLQKFKVYEKHFNPLEYTDTPDASCSASYAELRRMIEIINGRENYDYEAFCREESLRGLDYKRDPNTGFRPLPKSFLGD